MGLSGGLITWGVLCFLVTLVFTAWLLRHFSRPKTPPAISVIVYLAWLCAFSICFLIPLDLNVDASDSLEVIWTILFWVGFVCTWMLLPMIQEYYDNGGFTFKHKLLLACRQNGILVLIAGTLVIVLIIYLKAAKGMESSAIGVSSSAAGHSSSQQSRRDTSHARSCTACSLLTVPPHSLSLLCCVRQR